jgi:gamma-glutamyltranspeptidase
MQTPIYLYKQPTTALIGAQQTIASRAAPAGRAFADSGGAVADAVVAALGLDDMGLPLVDRHRSNLGPDLAGAPRAIGRNVAGLHGHAFERSPETVETLAPNIVVEKMSPDEKD